MLDVANKYGLGHNFPPLVTRQGFAPFKKLPFKNFKKLQMYLLVGKTKIPYDFTFLVE